MASTSYAYGPSPTILRERAEFAEMFSGLKRVRPRVPFWQLAAHRIPTLWTLYRGLMRNAPGEHIRWRMRMYFEQYRNLTSPRTTRDRLLQMHKYLDIFKAAKEGGAISQKILERYNAMIAAKRAKEHMKALIRDELDELEHQRRRPRLTGSFLRGSFYNPPLPRMKPQPLGLSMTIHKRLKKRQRRVEDYKVIKSFRDDLIHEAAFELKLSRQDPSFQPEIALNAKPWVTPISERMKELRGTFSRDLTRAWKPLPPDVLAAVENARRRNWLKNKLRHEREQRGLVTASVLRRQRQRPPAHVLAKMTDTQKHMDVVVRGVSEVGYVAMVKKQMGRKLKDEEKWKVFEEGREEDRPRLDAIDEEIRRTNEERRRKAEEIDGEP